MARYEHLPTNYLDMYRYMCLLPISKLLIVTAFLCLTWTALCGAGENSFQRSAKAGTVPPTPAATPTPSWSIDPMQTNIAVLTLSYATAQLQQAYLVQEATCTTPLTEQALIVAARAALSNTATGDLIALTTQAGGSLAESLEQQGEFHAWHVHLGDLTASVLLSPCTGNVIFAGESIWASHGTRPYPRDPLPAPTLLHLSSIITPPQSLTIVGQSEALTLTAEAAWSKLADLNLVHDLAQHPFKILAFLYRPATGYVEPAEELAQAEWVFLIYRAPLPRAQSRVEQYLPLIRQ